MSVPPTPGEFARQLAEQYAAPTDPCNPFHNRAEFATEQLILRAVVEVFGPKNPIAQFCDAFSKAERLSFPAHWAEDQGMMLETQIDNMRAAWEVIERDYCNTMDEMNGES